MKTKALKPPKVEEFFARCERDEGGHCLPEGESSASSEDEGMRRAQEMSDRAKKTKEGMAGRKVAGTELPNPATEKAAEQLQNFLSMGIGLGAETYTNDPKAKFRTPLEYVQAKGELYYGSPLPEGEEPGTPKECFANATHLVIQHSDWRYVEGFAMSEGLLPVLHGWCVTAEGKVVDNTFTDPERAAYFGVVYDRSAYLKHLYKAKFYGLLGGADKISVKILKKGGL